MLIVSLWKAEDAEFHPSLDTNESHLKFNPTVVDAVPFCPDSPGQNKGLFSPGAEGEVSPFRTLPFLMKTVSPKVTPLSVAAHIQSNDGLT